MLRSAALLAAVLAGCRLVPAPVTPERGTDLCARACAACPVDGPGPDLTEGTSDDLPCEQACADQLAADPTLDALLECTARAGSCEASRSCEESVP